MKGLAIHAVLAVAGLLFAYQTWTRPAVVEEEKPSDEVVLLPCQPDKLEQLELELPTHTVLLRPERQAGHTAYWITATPAKKPETTSPDDVQEAEVKGVKRIDATAPVTFRGNANTEPLLAQLLPVHAIRDLGKLEASRDAEFGFDKAGTHFRVKCDGKSIDLTVAGRTYGNNDSYVRDPKTGKTYLMLGKPFIDLQSAQYKLMQSELQPFTLADVDEAVISAGDQAKRLLQRDRAIKGQAQWVDADKPDQRNETFGNWFDRVARLRVRAYLPRGVEPGSELTPPAAAVPVMKIEYKLDGATKGHLEVVRVDGPDGEHWYYGRSDATDVWVTLFDTAVKEVEADLPLVVGEGANSSLAAPPK